MIRRMTLLRRKPDLSPEAFSQHWAEPHAAIAKGYPGLLKYTQNHVVRRLDTMASDTFGADGMAELWFADADAMKTATASPVTARLIEDEPRFLDGLTGLILGEAPLDDGQGGVKVIVLGRKRPAATVSVAPEKDMTFTSLAAVQGTFKRDALWTVPAAPDTVVVARFVSLDAAKAAVRKTAWSPFFELSPYHAYHVEEVRVV